MTTRREFVAAGAAMATSGKTLAKAIDAAAPSHPVQHILFQGDSITDVGRDRAHGTPNNQDGLGGGYPLFVAAALRDRYPKRDLAISNRGVSGNTVTDLTARWDTDTLALRPDLLSILIGVNDLWHTLDGNYDGTPEKYHAGYRSLIESTRTALPGVKLVILEPFALKTGAVTDKWFPEFDAFRAAAKDVAHAAHVTWIPLHDNFQKLARDTGPSYWLGDGVHPTLAGHAEIARRWIDAVKI